MGKRSFRGFARPGGGTRAGKPLLLAVISMGLIMLISAVGGAPPATVGSPLQLPPSFKMELFADGLPVPRFVAFSPEGDLYVANMGSGRVAVLPDRDHDGKADSVIAFASGFASPNNVAFRNGAVYVGELGRIWKLVDTNGDLVADTREVVIDNLPSDGRHRTKTVGFGPDGKLYINVGSFSDDAPEPEGRATVWQYNADGTGGRVFSRGLRNTVGFDWDPVTGQMWGVDNGADELGRNVPPDELNRLVDGGDYGFPYCIGNRQRNPNVPGGDCARTLPPAVALPAHSAPLGITFYTGSSFPSSYWGGLFVAQHSIQYLPDRALVFIPFKDGSPSGAPQTFAAGSASWLGLAVDPYDGSLLASQDRTGAIYKISYTGPTPAPTDAGGPAPTAVPGKPAPQPTVAIPGLSRCFSQTGKCLRGAFLNYWFTHGGLAQFGLPVTHELTERLGDGKTYTVQYTERARFEWHPENRGKESQVLLGRLGADLSASRATQQPFRQVPRCASCNLLYFKETGHHLGAEFRAYWERNGGIPVFGYPLSEAFQEPNPTDGKNYLVQYFERNRLEYHPENKGTQFEVLLGLLGVQTYQSRYGARP
jgi:glucose/arabinose dehydrogenase